MNKNLEEGKKTKIWSLSFAMIHDPILMKCTNDNQKVIFVKTCSLDIQIPLLQVTISWQHILDLNQLMSANRLMFLSQNPSM